MTFFVTWGGTIFFILFFRCKGLFASGLGTYGRVCGLAARVVHGFLTGLAYCGNFGYGKVFNRDFLFNFT